MKKLAALLSMVLLLSSCGSQPQPVPIQEQSVQEPPRVEESVPDSPLPEETEDPSVYKPEKSLTPEETVRAYFEQQYLSYISFSDIDLSAIIDMRSTTNLNMIRWMKMLTQRRKLISEYGFCYVETEKLPYTVLFEEDAEDGRMGFWEKRIAELGATVLHFRIEGEEGQAYPPIMALNSQHSIWLVQVDGVWKIALHYFPGSRRKYGTGTVKTLTDEKMLADLKIEFWSQTQSEPEAIPEGARVYNSEAAIDYAIEYTEEKNPDFYDIGDWIGNCANFVSQSVWAGFGADKMTGDWYNGSPAWNHVGYFWEYITSDNALGGMRVGGISEVENGDIIQTRPASMTEEPDRFTHELIVVDDLNLKLAQNTPAAFVYYSDLVNVQTRIIRPLYIN